MKKYFEKFKYGKIFEYLPEKLGGMGEYQVFGRGALFDLYLDETKVDMIPAGLKGVTCVYFKKKPLFIAPDFEGEVRIHDCDYSLMEEEEIKAAKVRFNRYREWVESPRYIKESDGSLSLCSLPKNIKIMCGYLNYCQLDLTQTDITEKQDFGDAFDKVIVSRLRSSSLSNMPNPQKMASHKGKMKTPVAGRQRV